METIYIAAANETPEVKLDTSKGIFSFKGKSYPENVNAFYSEILDTLKNYTLNPAENTLVEFEWVYYNTATSKIIVKIIQEIQKIKTSGKQVQIKWSCKKSDDLMIEKGEELQDLFEVPFEIITK